VAYLVTFAPSASRQLADLPEDAQRRLVPLIDALADNPHPGPPLGRQMQGKPTRWRLKAPPYRIVTRVDARAKTVTITWLGLRRDAYRAR